MSDRALVTAVTTRTIKFRATVRAVVTATVSVDEDEVREYFSMDADARVSVDELQEYVFEELEPDLDWDLFDIKFYDHTEIEWDRSSKRMRVPPAFVPLPGLDGEL